MKTLKSKIAVVIAALLVIGAAFAVGTSVHLVANTASAAPTFTVQDTTTSIYNNAAPAVVEINITQTVNTGSGILRKKLWVQVFWSITREIS